MLNGKRIRKNFQLRKDAVVERDRLTIEFLSETPEGRSTWTTLTPEQNRDAIAAVSRLHKTHSKRSLSFAVDFFLEHFHEAAVDTTLKNAATHYVANRRKDWERDIISRRQFKSIKSEVERLCHQMGSRVLTSVTPKDLSDYLEAGEFKSLKTWNNRRGLLHTFFTFCETEKFIGHNPVSGVVQHKIRRRRSTAETLSAEKAKALMRFLESYTGPAMRRPSTIREPGFLVPFFAIALFAGIRPDWKDGEIRKIRPKHFNHSTGVIRVEPEVSKINEKRIITIQPNLERWLSHYPIPAQGVVPALNAERVLRDIRVRFELGHDVLRHTFISMTVGAFRSVGDAALQAGNSESVIRKHYLDLIAPDEADQFWQILPLVEPPLSIHEKRNGRYITEPQ